MDNEKKKKLIKALKDYKEAHHEILTIWLEDNSDEVDQILSSDYPLGRCFTELEQDIAIWVEDVIDKLNKPRPYKEICGWCKNETEFLMELDGFLRCEYCGGN